MNEEDGDRQFITFVHKLRKQQNYTMEQLCEGICSLGTIHSIENGKWKPDKLVRDCILDRLGVNAEDYEHFLDLAEYNRWEARHRILHCITFQEIRQAEKLLENYEKTYDMGNRLEKQFCLGMRAQVRRWRECSREELSHILMEAVALTVPDFPHKNLEQLVLSTRELNLILETEHYREEEERARQYREIVSYIERRQLDGISRVKIYPKAIYFLCRCLLAQQNTEKAEQEYKALLQYCNRAIEILRENAKMYYLWEILETEKQLVNSLTEYYTRQGQSKRADELKEQYQKRECWKLALETLYAEYRISARTQDFCYFYIEKGCHCINDVIRIRRQMLGMSRKKLSQGICDEKTLKRLEHKKTKTQWTIVEKLLERLSLPAEFTRTDLITASHEAKKLMEKLRNCINRNLWEQIQPLVKQIRTLVPMDIKYNQQTLENFKIFYYWKKKDIDYETYYKNMISVLELTLPYEAFLKKGEKYLTTEEQVCTQNLMIAMEDNAEECTLCMQNFKEMYQPYIEKGLQETAASVYASVMYNIANKLGNRGEYISSDQYSEAILKDCLRFRKLELIDSCLYNIWRNYDIRKSKGLPITKTLDDMEELKKCIAFADIMKNTKKEQFYQSKLNEFSKNDT